VHESISTVIVGARALLREGLASLLQRSAYKVSAGVAQASELANVQIPAGNQILIILLINGDDENLEEAAASIRLLRSLFPDSRVVVVAETSSTVDIQQILTLAPDGYIVNLGSRDILLKALELTALNQQVFVMKQPLAPSIGSDCMEAHQPKSFAESLARADTEPECGAASASNDLQLSRREQQILSYLAQGKPNKVIARLCKITESTVKLHLTAILRKTDTRNRTEAAVWAVANGYQRGSRPETHVVAAAESPSVC
jgi:two-component system nitrate/nitrite response regulator NarL